MHKNISTYFYLLTGSVFLILTAPHLFTEGMVMDGVLYASISRNLAYGLGTFWEPFLSHGLFPQFHEHPPLAIGLQSILFKLIGDSIYIERIYSLLMFFLIGIGVVKVWKEITDQYTNGWVPLLFYFAMLKIPWACANNMLENTMTVFLTFSMLFLLKGIKSKAYLHFLISGALIFLAFLTKGFVGLYLWTFPFFYWLFAKRTSFIQTILKSFYLIIVTIAPLFILFTISDNAYDSILAYYNKQVLGSISNTTTVDSRFFIIVAVLYHSIPILGIISITVVLSKLLKQKLPIEKKFFHLSLVFFGVATCGIFPIMISLKQSGHYAITTYPFIAIGFALIFNSIITQLLFKLKAGSKRILMGITATLVLFSLIFTLQQFGNVKYQKEELSDCKAVINIVGKEKSINISPDIYNHWFLHGYFARYGNVSLIPSNSPSFDYYLSKNSANKIINYKEVVLPLNGYKLYKKSN